MAGAGAAPWVGVSAAGVRRRSVCGAGCVFGLRQPVCWQWHIFGEPLQPEVPHDSYLGYLKRVP